jgi:hypothetical protein
VQPGKGSHCRRDNRITQKERVVGGTVSGSFGILAGGHPGTYLAVEENNDTRSPRQTSGVVDEMAADLECCCVTETAWRLENLEGAMQGNII